MAQQIQIVLADANLYATRGVLEIEAPLSSVVLFDGTEFIRAPPPRLITPRGVRVLPRATASIIRDKKGVVRPLWPRIEMDDDILAHLSRITGRRT